MRAVVQRRSRASGASCGTGAKRGGIFGSPEARAPKRMLRKGVEPLTLSLLDSCATNCANRARVGRQTETGTSPARTHRPPLPSSPVLPSLDECGGQLTVAGESCTVSSWRCRAAGHRLGSGQSTPSVVPQCSREQRTSSSQMEGVSVVCARPRPSLIMLALSHECADDIFPAP